MSTIEEQTNKAPITIGAETPVDFQIPEASSSGLSRRRLFKTGLGVAAPVVMTLASRPVLAWHCTSPSAWGSLSRSRKVTCTTVEYYTCTGDQWKAMCNSQPCYNNQGYQVTWPSACGNKSTLTMAQCGLGSSSTKVKDCLTTGTNSFDKILVAAYLNCKAGWVDATICLKASTIQSMYNSCKTGGYYTPSAGVKWYQADVLKYLDQNWIACQTSFSGSWTAQQGCK